MVLNVRHVQFERVDVVSERAGKQDRILRHDSKARAHRLQVKVRKFLVRRF